MIWNPQVGIVRSVPNDQECSVTSCVYYFFDNFSKLEQTHLEFSFQSQLEVDNIFLLHIFLVFRLCLLQNLNVTFKIG